MFPTSSKPLPSTKPIQSIGSSNRHQPRPKGSIKLSPGSKSPLNLIELKHGSSAKIFLKKKEKGKLDKKKAANLPEINSKKNFQSEMKAFVKNKEVEREKEEYRAKMNIVYNLMQCITPFEDHEKISFDFIEDFLAVGNDLFPSFSFENYILKLSDKLKRQIELVFHLYNLMREYLYMLIE
jgi:hypothetical protein